MSGTNKAFGGFDSYDEFMTYYDNPWHGHCIEFEYKGEFYQIVRDYKHNLAGEENKQTTVYWWSEYLDNTNFDRAFLKDSKTYFGHDLRPVVEDYKFFDGATIKEALFKGDFEFT